MSAIMMLRVSAIAVVDDDGEVHGFAEDGDAVNPSSSCRSSRLLR